MSDFEQTVLGMYNLKDEIGRFNQFASLIQVNSPISDLERVMLPRDLSLRAYNPLVLPGWIIANDKPIILVDQERISDGVNNFDLGYEVADIPSGRFTYTVPRVKADVDRGYLISLAKDYLMSTGQSRILLEDNRLQVIDQILLGEKVFVVSSDLPSLPCIERIADVQRKRYGLNLPSHQVRLRE